MPVVGTDFLGTMKAVVPSGGQASVHTENVSIMKFSEMKRKKNSQPNRWKRAVLEPTKMSLYRELVEKVNLKSSVHLSKTMGVHEAFDTSSERWGAHRGALIQARRAMYTLPIPATWYADTS